MTRSDDEGDLRRGTPSVQLGWDTDKHLGVSSRSGGGVISQPLFPVFSRVLGSLSTPRRSDRPSLRPCEKSRFIQKGSPPSRLGTRTRRRPWTPSRTPVALPMYSFRPRTGPTHSDGWTGSGPKRDRSRRWTVDPGPKGTRSQTVGQVTRATASESCHTGVSSRVSESGEDSEGVVGVFTLLTPWGAPATPVAS